MPPMADPISSSIAVTAPDIALGSALCTQCGLCCTGALHKAAVLESEEIEPARALGLPVINREKPAFSLPCPRLDGAVCTIYDSRPSVCSRYKCQLLQDLEGGMIELDEALGKVACAKALREKAESVMPPGMTLPEARDVAQATLAAQADDSGVRAELMPLALHITGFNLYLDRNFRNSRDGRAFDLTLVGGSDDMEKT